MALRYPVAFNWPHLSRFLEEMQHIFFSDVAKWGVLRQSCAPKTCRYASQLYLGHMQAKLPTNELALIENFICTIFSNTWWYKAISKFVYLGNVIYNGIPCEIYEMVLWIIYFLNIGCLYHNFVWSAKEKPLCQTIVYDVEIYFLRWHSMTDVSSRLDEVLFPFHNIRYTVWPRMLNILVSTIFVPPLSPLQLRFPSPPLPLLPLPPLLLLHHHHHCCHCCYSCNCCCHHHHCCHQHHQHPHLCSLYQHYCCSHCCRRRYHYNQHNTNTFSPATKTTTTAAIVTATMTHTTTLILHRSLYSVINHVFLCRK